MEDSELTGGNTLHLTQTLDDKPESKEPEVEVKINNVSL